MAVLILAAILGLALSALVILADVWEERRRAERQHHALRSFYERGPM